MSENSVVPLRWETREERQQNTMMQHPLHSTGVMIDARPELTYIG